MSASTEHILECLGSFVADAVPAEVEPPQSLVICEILHQGRRSVVEQEVVFEVEVLEQISRLQVAAELLDCFVGEVVAAEVQTLQLREVLEERQRRQRVIGKDGDLEATDELRDFFQDVVAAVAQHAVAT